MARGRFITLEGGDGAGKTTQARLLAEALRKSGWEVVTTREPGGTPAAEALRNVLLKSKILFTPDAEALLQFAARTEHVARKIRPALDRGAWVVCDRFYDSTMAYQGFGLDVDRGKIAALIDMLDLVPDVTFVLDLPPEVGAARLVWDRAAMDRFERMDAAFHRRVAEGFQAIAAAEPERCVLVDATLSLEEVRAKIAEELAARV